MKKENGNKIQDGNYIIQIKKLPIGSFFYL